MSIGVPSSPSVGALLERASAQTDGSREKKDRSSGSFSGLPRAPRFARTYLDASLKGLAHHHRRGAGLPDSAKHLVFQRSRVSAGVSGMV